MKSAVLLVVFAIGVTGLPARAPLDRALERLFCLTFLIKSEKLREFIQPYKLAFMLEQETFGN
jgi:hypothetical protein